MIPETSTTLLRNVTDAEHPRWPEFVAKYRPMMEAYLNAHFPTLEADDVIQETFAARRRCLRLLIVRFWCQILVFRCDLALKSL